MAQDSDDGFYGFPSPAPTGDLSRPSAFFRNHRRIAQSHDLDLVDYDAAVPGSGSFVLSGSSHNIARTRRSGCRTASQMEYLVQITRCDFSRNHSSSVGTGSTSLIP